MTSKSTSAIVRTNYNGYAARRPTAQGISKLLFLGLAQTSHVVAAPLKKYLGLMEKEPKDPEDPSLWLYLTIAATLVLLGGAFAGLTIALMGQDGVYLQVIATSGEGKEQRHAQKVFTLLQKGKHWVLVTLLLSNVIVNESLPIVLDRSLGGGWPAVLGSTVLIVIFGEVIPQSVCVRYGLSIGAYMAPFVLALMWVLAPIAWPTAKLLDKLLGEDHGTVYKKAGLKTLVTLHKTLGTAPTERLNQDEVTIISAVLDLKDKAVGDIMTPMEDVFTMSEDTVLDEETMNIILSAGYSRIPIYETGNPENFTGMLLVKILITYDPEDCKKVSEFALATLPETRPETSCLDIVNFFQEGKSHMVLVSEYPGENYGAIGVCTLEDVIEELIGEEIIDESDVYIDVHKAIRRMAPAPKARIQRGPPPTEVVGKAPEDNLIDLSESNGAPMVKSLTNGDSRTENPLVHFSTSPKTTFIRRASAGADGNPIQVRGNFNDMREHLKHLGPSNHASRPKTTRFNTVKIKSAQSTTRSDSRTESQGYQDSHGYRDSIDERVGPSTQGGEGEGLLRSAGMDAKDGVQAVQQGYGSFERSSPTRHSQKEHNYVDGPPTETNVLGGKGGASDYVDGNEITKQNSQDSKKSDDTLGSLPSSTRSQSFRRKTGVARSGSITENIIEAGGIRKVVLETNSSSDEQREDGDANKGGSMSNSMSLPSAVDGNTSSLDGQEDNHGSSTGAKKKRRRNRKKKPKTSGEDGSTAEGSTQG